MTSTSCDNLKKEDTLIQIREKLRNDQVKLWIEPYFNETNGPINDELKRLAEDYSVTLNIDFDLTLEAINTLQQNAIEKLKQRTKFDDTGLASIKIKIVHQNTSNIISKEISLNMNVSELKKIINDDLFLSSDEKIKFICSGKVLKDNESLLHQGVKNGQTILALILNCSNQAEFEQNENQFKELEETKSDSKLIALDDQFVQLEDQKGNSVKLSPSDKKALIVALTLEEKGKTAMQLGDYSRALVFFLEADNEYKNCNSNIVTCADNYSLLNLDIAWCYLCLQSVSNLPAAEERLKRCEKSFDKTYGPNLERVYAIKGHAGNEAIHLLRLHLLQGIIAYHQNKRSEALNILKNVQIELNRLKVDESKVYELMELGYTMSEAKVGLRATSGDLNSAANHINDLRAQEIERKEKLKERRELDKLNKERRKLGKCADGKTYVEPSYVKLLIGMGYSKEAARIALQKCNNIITNSIQYIQDNPMPSSSKANPTIIENIEILTSELVQAGFDANSAKSALEKHKGNVEEAVKQLTEDTEKKLKTKEKKAKSDQELAEKTKACNRILKEINEDSNQYLDVTLKEEETFLNTYLDLLQN